MSRLPSSGTTGGRRRIPPGGVLVTLLLLFGTLVVASAVVAGRGWVALPPAPSSAPAVASAPPASASAGRDGLVEPPSHRGVGLPASVAAVLVVGVAWGLLRVRRSLPVERGRHASGVRRTVLR